MIVFGRFDRYGEVVDTCGQVVLLVVNVICEDFAGLTVIFHCSIQF
jgi:hypothetical protein